METEIQAVVRWDMQRSTKIQIAALIIGLIIVVSAYFAWTAR